MSAGEYALNDLTGQTFMELELATIDASQLALSYKNQIREHHELGKKADADLLKAGLNKIKIAKETGQLILAARSNLSQTEFDFATDFLSRSQIKGYTRYVKAVELIENPNAQLYEIMPAAAAGSVLTGALPMPAGHGVQHAHEPNFFSHAIGLIQKLLGIYRHYLRRFPLKHWREDQLQSLIASLRPVADAYRDLTRELETR